MNYKTSYGIEWEARNLSTMSSQTLSIDLSVVNIYNDTEDVHVNSESENLTISESPSMSERLIVVSDNASNLSTFSKAR